MAEKTGITWTDSTANPWRGCVKVSPGCALCYAERGSRRNPKVLGIWGSRGTRVLAAEAQWATWKRWNEEAYNSGKKHLVFLASLADVFEDWDGQMTDSQGRRLWFAPGLSGMRITLEKVQMDGSDATPFTLNHARERLWDLIRRTPALTWQILTKRPENIARMMPSGAWPNVWLGVSVENAEYLWRADVLADVPQNVPIRFLSLEPLLGPLPMLSNVLGGIQWAIVGGESGGEARSLDVQWIRDIVRQCQEANVACFVKQLGRSPISYYTTTGQRFALPMTHDGGHGGDIRDWPSDLVVRQFPEESIMA